MKLVLKVSCLPSGYTDSTCPWNMCSSHCSRAFVDNGKLPMIWIPKPDEGTPWKESCRLTFMKIDGNTLKQHRIWQYISSNILTKWGLVQLAYRWFSIWKSVTWFITVDWLRGSRTRLVGKVIIARSATFPQHRQIEDCPLVWGVKVVWICSLWEELEIVLSVAPLLEQF